MRTVGPTADIPEIVLDGRTLDHRQIAVAAERGARVRLTTDSLERAGRSWEFAAGAASRRTLYGRSTGVGANRTALVTGDAAAHTLRLLRSHATSAGELRSAGRVRAMLLVRLNQLAAGGSGVDPAILVALAGMIDADALPFVRELGSIGTADLSALATTALALTGEVPTTRPLTGLIAFDTDGLAFLSSNAAVLGDAALAVASLAEAAQAAVVVAALTFHAAGGNAEAYSGAALRTTPFPGAVRVGIGLRWLLAADRSGTRRDVAGAPIPPARIQDPFALRVVPQTHGPVLDAVTAAADVIDRLVNAPTENPLTIADPEEPDGGVVAHHGGFHQAYLQMALDSLSLAVAQSGQLVLARLATLVEPAFTGLAPFLGDGTPGASGVMVCEYVAASALASIRAAATPAGLQTVTLSRGVEEDASFASLAAVQCLNIAQRYRELLAGELVAAVRANRMGGARPVGGPLGEALALCRPLSAEFADRDLTDDLAVGESLLPSLAAFLSAGVHYT